MPNYTVTLTAAQDAAIAKRTGGAFPTVAAWLQAQVTELGNACARACIDDDLRALGTLTSADVDAIKTRRGR